MKNRTQHWFPLTIRIKPAEGAYWFRWGIVVAYVLTIFISLSLTPLMLANVVAFIGRKNTWILITSGLFICFIGMFFILFLRMSKKVWWLVVGPMLAIAGFAFFMDNPVERIHLLEYALLAFLMSWAARWPRGKGVLAVGVVALLLGVTDECIQWFLPNRHFDLWDIGLNSVGVSVGVWFGFVLRQSAVRSVA